MINICCNKQCKHGSCGPSTGAKGVAVRLKQAEIEDLFKHNATLWIFARAY
jgi:hypothetical protein